jgi:hypothetical protein
MNSSYKLLAHFLTAALAILSFAPASRVQGQALTGAINVPFSFNTGYHQFGPGFYNLRIESANVISVRRAADGGTMIARQAGARLPGSRGKVIFRRTGNHYFMSEIWTPQTGSYLVVVKSKAEHQEVIAAARTATDNVELALLEAR